MAKYRVPAGEVGVNLIVESSVGLFVVDMNARCVNFEKC